MNSEETLPEFGIKRPNEERRDGGFGIVFDPKSKKFAVGKLHQNGSYRLFSGGIDEGEDMEKGTLREVIEESGLYDFEYIENLGQGIGHFFNPLRKINRVALFTCILIILKSTDLKPVKLEEHENFSLAWVSADELLKDLQSQNENKDTDHWIHFLKKAVNKLKELGYEIAL